MLPGHWNARFLLSSLVASLHSPTGGTRDHLIALSSNPFGALRPIGFLGSDFSLENS